MLIVIQFEYKITTLYFLNTYNKMVEAKNKMKILNPTFVDGFG